MEKVLFVMNEPMHKGGSQGVMMNIVRNLSKRYIFDILLFSNQESYYDREFASYGGTIIRVPHYNGNSALRKRLDIYIRGNKVYSAVHDCILNHGPYKVIHCMNGFEAGFALKAAFDLNVGIRITHSLIVTDTRKHYLRTVYNFLTSRLVEKYATHKISVSKPAQESTYKCDDRCHIITPSYNDTVFNPQKYDDTVLDVPSLIQIGSYSPNKNQLFSAKVLKALTAQFPDAKLQFVGFDVSGEYLRMVECFVRDNNLSENVVFHPHDADAPALLNESTHMLLPSLHEGFGIVLVEAQAMGVSCIVSDSVPDTANADGCVFVSLDDGPEKWADLICDSFRKTGGGHVFYDCSAFADGQIAERYSRIYSE